MENTHSATKPTLTEFEINDVQIWYSSNSSWLSWNNGHIWSLRKKASELTACGAGRSGPVELARPQRDGWNPAKNDDFPPELHLPRGGGGVSSAAMLPRPKPVNGSARGE